MRLEGHDERQKLAICRENVITTNQFKTGNHIDVEGTIFKILDFQHVKPGKGGAFVRTKLRRASDGAVIDRTFRAGEKFRPVHTEARKMQFLYADGNEAHFMDTESYEQIAVSESAFAEPLQWIKASSEVDMLFIDDEPTDLQLPTGVELEVTATDPGLTRRHGIGRRHQARNLRDRRNDPRSPVCRGG